MARLTEVAAVFVALGRDMPSRRRPRVAQLEARVSWGLRGIPVTLPSPAPRKAARLTIQATSQPLPGMRARPDLGGGYRGSRTTAQTSR